MDSKPFGEDDDWEEEDEPAPVAAAKKPPAPIGGPAAAANGRGGGANAAAQKVGKADASVRQEQHRQARLAEEAATRSRVSSIKARLELGLATLRDAVGGNTAFASQHLQDLSPLVLPVLGSKIVGGAAYQAIVTLGRCLPGSLGQAAFAVAAALKQVVLARAGRDGASYTDLPAFPAVGSVVRATAHVTADVHKALSPAAYTFLFPVLQAVLASPGHTPLHDAALSVVALHVSPGQDVPRGETLEMLYRLLETIPAYRCVSPPPFVTHSHTYTPALCACACV